MSDVVGSSRLCSQFATCRVEHAQEYQGLTSASLFEFDLSLTELRHLVSIATKRGRAGARKALPLCGGRHVRHQIRQLGQKTTGSLDLLSITAKLTHDVAPSVWKRTERRQESCRAMKRKIRRSIPLS